MSQAEQSRKLYEHRKSLLQELKRSYDASEEPDKQQLWEMITNELQDILKKYTLDFSKEQMKIFNDPIHGHIALHPLLVKITDTPQFQRLRHLKQLGGTYLVYPGASHNRFEHSIGVAYLAGRLVKSLHDNQPELKITKQDFLCVQIAGLCHDLGLPDDIPESWKHEQMSVLMFDSIVKSLNEEVLREHGLTDNDVIFIKELIEGAKASDNEWPYKGRNVEKSFLYEIVANKQNGIDVDKWDYFARDCHHLGIRNSFDHLRLLKFARVCVVNGRKHICFRDKEADNVYDMFRTRYTLHRQAYQHKIGNIIEDMFAEALLLADRDLHEDRPADMLKISEAIKSVEDYSKLTDEIFEQILSSTSPNLKESRDILDKIMRRKLPKFIGETRLTKKIKSMEELKNSWKAAIEKYKPTDPNVNLTTEELPVYVVDLDHGMKDKNPIEHVYFYSKRKPNEASTIEDYQLSSFLPNKFNEELVRVYYRGSGPVKEEEKKMEEAEKCFQTWC
ncbi:deoxynucleoside triphosphate triphosphohydrolase SAMHD1 isoform X2 [Danio rerio]|uniref:Deoxynucleoside triphosphate triphosphohydrolase SAMHD1 isoform X2 n=1 Tax=Danio rerio TaxID=7955 RepID=A0AB32TSS2_DANRE